MPSSPRLPSLRHSSAGNWFVASISAARGATSLRAKSCTLARSMAIVSPCSNRRKGRSMGERWKPMVGYRKRQSGVPPRRAALRQALADALFEHADLGELRLEVRALLLERGLVAL